MNKITKKDMVEGIVFILMVVGIIGLMCVLYEVNYLKGLTNSATDFRTIRK